MANTETIEQIAKQLRNEKLKDWRRRNPDKVKEYNQNYWKRKAEKMLQAQK